MQSHNSNQVQNVNQNQDIIPKPNTSIVLRIENDTSYVELPCVESVHSLKLLIDTGASISLIKFKSVKDIHKINQTIKFTLKGVNDSPNPTETLGAINLQFPTLPRNISHNVNVIPNDQTNIPLDGLLGEDFFKKHKAIIDYEQKILIIKGQHIPILDRDKNILQILKPRTETVVELDILNPEIKEGIVPGREILPGVHIAKAITKVRENNKAFVTIMNNTERSVRLLSNKTVLEPFNENESFIYYQRSNSYDSSRLERLNKELRLSHLNTEEERSILEICKKFSHVFHLDGDNLSHTTTIEHEIPVSSQTPIFTKSYRYPEVHKSEVQNQINKMLDQQIIQPSSSPWSSPLWIVPKKIDSTGKQKWRVVIDYRKLNNITVGDAYPLPNISEILDQLGHSKYFTTLDLASGFHQIPISPADAAKTAFSTPNGHYQFSRMPFGLKNAPATFQRLMNNVLTGLQGLKCFVYLDDIVIFADSIETHSNKLIEILKRLENHNLKLQPDKCEFMRHEVAYLGHIVSKDGVKPNPEKIDCIKNYPRPLNTKDIKSFLGLVGYYRKFIPAFSNSSQKLTCLLKKNVDFKWSDTQEEAFQSLKNSLISEPILQYPDFSKSFTLTTDASNFAIGAVLSQGSKHKDLPIAYASRTLNKAESNYSTTEKELLAIVWACQHYRPYLYGRKFQIVTDHRPLTWLFNCKDPSSRLVRWRLKLEEYDYEIIYKPGRINSNADALSRIPLQTINSIITIKDETIYNNFLENQNNVYDLANFSETDESLLNQKTSIGHCISNDKQMSSGIASEIRGMISNYEELLKINTKISDVLISQNNEKNIYHLITKQNYWEKPSYLDLFCSILNLKRKLEINNEISISLPRIGCGIDRLNWEKVKQMILFIFHNSSINVTICHNKIVNPNRDDIPQILKEYHDSPIGGHMGYHRMLNRIKMKYRWTKMNNDISNFIKSCDSCQRNKISRQNVRQPMEITTTSNRAFERIALDIVGPLPLSENGNRFILTLQDDLTKFSQAYPIPNHEAETIAKVFVTQFICKFGIPDSILTDQGSDFKSKLLKTIANLFKIKQLHTTAYHPQSNGALERSHATLGDYLRHYVNNKQTDWDDWIDFAMFTYNTTPHSSSKFTPHELIFGEKPILPSAITQNPEFKYTYDDFIDNLKLKLNYSRQIARDNLIENKQKSKDNYDKHINKSVKFNVNDFVYLRNDANKSGKLGVKYNGPYQIISVNSPVNVTLKIKNKSVKVHINRIKHAT